MESSIPEEVLCPICYGFPMKEIYQCRNGHIVCHTCADSLSECPQCRIKFETNKIRNRVLETLLDSMTIECSYKGLGCTVKDTRKNISSHMETCSVRLTTVPMCEHLGLECGFMFNPKMCQQSIEHFWSVHDFVLSEDPVVLISLEGVMELVRNQCSLWKPLLLNLHSSLGVTLLVVIRYNEDDQTISFICLELSDTESRSYISDEEIQIEFCIKKPLHSNETAAPDLKWTCPTVNIQHAINAIKYPQFSFKLSHLINFYVVEGSLWVQCSVGKTRSTAINVETVSTIYLLHSPCEVSPPLSSPALRDRGERASNDSGASVPNSVDMRIGPPPQTSQRRLRREAAPCVPQNTPWLVSSGPSRTHSLPVTPVYTPLYSPSYGYSTVPTSNYSHLTSYLSPESFRNPRPISQSQPPTSPSSNTPLPTVPPVNISQILPPRFSIHRQHNP